MHEERTAPLITFVFLTVTALKTSTSVERKFLIGLFVRLAETRYNYSSFRYLEQEPAIQRL